MLDRLLCMLAGPGGDAVCRNLSPSPQHLPGHCSPPRSGGGGHARLLRRSHARGEAGEAGYADVKSQVQVRMPSLHSPVSYRVTERRSSNLDPFCLTASQPECCGDPMQAERQQLSGHTNVKNNVQVSSPLIIARSSS